MSNQAIEILERKLSEVKRNHEFFSDVNPDSRMVSIQEYAWRAIGFHLNEVLTEIKELQS